MKKYYLLIAALLLFFNMQGYGQQQEPQFIMPLVFIDANNDSDTLWLGYDPDASLNIEYLDTIFGETVEWIDTTKFHVYWYQYIDGYPYASPSYPIMTDTVGKVSIWGGGLEAPGYVGFVNGEMPMTIKWVDSLLDSPNLPDYYPSDIAPRPRARIDIYNDGLQAGYCWYDEPFVLSSYPPPEYHCDLGCCVTDSLNLKELPGWEPGVMRLYVIVSPHNGGFMDVEEMEEAEVATISPNPTTGVFEIGKINSSFPEGGKGDLILRDFAGKELVKIQFRLNEPIDISNLEQGIYFITIKYNTIKQTYSITKKIIKL